MSVHIVVDDQRRDCPRPLPILGQAPSLPKFADRDKEYLCGIERLRISSFVHSLVFERSQPTNRGAARV